MASSSSDRLVPRDEYRTAHVGCVRVVSAFGQDCGDDSPIVLRRTAPGEFTDRVEGARADLRGRRPGVFPDGLANPPLAELYSRSIAGFRNSVAHDHQSIAGRQTLGPFGSLDGR